MSGGGDGRRAVRLRVDHARYERDGRGARIAGRRGDPDIDNCKVGPCKVKVSRKTEFTAFAEKAGYQPGSLLIKTQVGGGGAAGLAGNILVGGVIGVGVDAATGASLDHYPNPATIVLLPIDPANPATPTFEAPPPPPKPKVREQRVARK